MSWNICKAVAQTCSVKKVLLEISQDSQENTCARVSILIKLEASSRTFPVAASEIYGLYIFRKKIHKHMYIICLVYLISSLRVQIWSYFWSTFSCIWTEYREIRTRNNSVLGHFSPYLSSICLGPSLFHKFVIEMVHHG